MTRRRSSALTGLSLLTAALPLAVAPARAQVTPGDALPATPADAAATSAPGTDQPFGDIVVTAQRRSENLQKVPISVSAFSGRQLAELGVNSVTGITQQVPGMHLNAWSPNVTIFNLRGVSQNNFTDNLEAPVAVYFDGAYMGSINGVSGQLFDIDRVEVLRGPQGTLFGRNATGGLVQYLSHPARETAFNGYVEGSYGRFNQRSLEAAIGGSITPDIRFRVAARRSLMDGYVTSADADAADGLTGDGQALGGENAFSLRATAQIDVTRNLQIELWYKRARDHAVPTGGYVFDNCDFEPNGYCHVNRAGLSDGTGGVVNGITGAPASPYQNFSNTPGYLDRTVSIYQANVNWKLGGGVTLTSITSLTRLKKDYLEDGDATPLTTIVFGTRANFHQFSQELRLAGENGRLKWQAGAYYLDMLPTGTLTTIGAPVIGEALALNGAYVSPQTVENYRLRSLNWSLFGQGEYRLSDRFTLIGGLRYSNDHKTVRYVSTLLDTGFPAQTLATDALFAAQRPGVNRIAYGDYAARVTLNWTPVTDLLLFASYNRGIKGGNWTLSPSVTADTFRHDPETLHSFELGTKYATPDRRLRVNATAFHYVYDNYQAFALVGGTPQVTNTNATATGAELETVWHPATHLNLLLGGTWETSRVDRVRAAGQQYGPVLFPGAPSSQYCVNEDDADFNCTFPAAVVNNAKLPNAPRFSANYLVRYDVPIGRGTGAFQVDGAWYGAQYLEVTNGASSLQPAYAVTNLSASWTAPGGRFDLTLWGRNVFDTAYRTYTLNLGILGTTSFYGLPATYGVTGRVHW